MFFVAKTQATCYAGLWYVSGSQPRVDSQLPSVDAVNTEESPTFSILAISGAMYLLLSIAAADLWAGCALCKEGRDSGGNRFRGRKVFGVCLVGTFVTLIGASIRVLFYSSLENVELVIGAAAVLFIADVVSEPGLSRAVRGFIGSSNRGIACRPRITSVFAAMYEQ